MRQRFFGLYLFFVIFFVAILARLFYWQVLNSASLKTQAQNQRQAFTQKLGLRGQILTNDGSSLAENIELYRLTTNPKISNWSFEQSQSLMSLLTASDAAKLSDRIANKKLQWVQLADRINFDLKNKIEALKLPGIGFELNPIRDYPEGSISAHLTGFVGQDEAGKPKGYFGLEGYYDRALSGRFGRTVEEKDALGRPIVIGNQTRIDELNGSDLQTSIDQTLQYIAYSKLVKALDKYQALAGTVTIMNAKTGEIWAMVSLPNYDPRKYWEFDSSLYKNPAVADTYEPGSTFKVLVMAAGLDAKVIKDDSICTICDQPVEVSGYTIRTWDDKYHPNSTMTDVLTHSDNVGMVFIANKLGKQKFLDYVNKFGFGQKTGIDLQEETPGVIHPANDFKDIDLATASFGQGIAVTPIQMVRAVGAIANRGVLPAVRLVSTDQVAQPVISPQTAAMVTRMMVASVDNGEAKWAKPDGYSIAGKTGTAQIPVAGHYDKDKTIASFVGFAPASDPKFVMLVTLDQPQSSQWGSETAAPLWFDIAEEAFRYLKIPPSN